MSEDQVEEFQKELAAVFDPSRRFTKPADRLYSFCFGFYSLIRVTLEATYKLNQYFDKKYSNQELQQYREDWFTRIDAIRQIANDIVKHPLDDETRKKDYFFEPGGSDSMGSVTIYKWWIDPQKEMDFSKEIKPAIDLQTVFDYLEGLAEKYSAVLGAVVK